MKYFKAKNFLTILALGGMIVFAGTTPAAQVIIEVSVVVNDNL